jgi:uncharacterized protein
VNTKNAWISTYTGKQFFLLHPTAKSIDIRDIAHSLAMQCRWTGHSIYHYSVAQHSYYCSFLVPEGYELEALLHDASEAYCGDLNRPLKHFTPAGPAYRAQEAIVMNAIRLKFKLPLVESPFVKEADDKMLYAERDQIVIAKHKWGCKWGSGKGAKIKISRWSPKKAEMMFLQRFKQLKGTI